MDRQIPMNGAERFDVSIIVVSYNTRALTLAALDSIADQTRGVSYEVIVVDNASTDGSAAAIAAHPLKPTLIALEDNIGFARANNLASEHARGYYVLLLNSDTVVLNSAIDQLVAFARANRHALIWGGRTLLGNGKLNPGSCWGRLTPWSLLCRLSGLTAILPNSWIFNPETYGDWQRDDEREVDIVSGCFLMIPRSIWMALGGFDPLFFMYGEDADLCLRAARIGARPMVTPSATITHYGGASERILTDKMIKLLSANASLIERHWPLPLRMIGQHALTLWPLTRWLALSVFSMIAGSQSARAKANTWRDIWIARDIWRFGYDRANPIEAELTAAEPIASQLNPAS